MAPSRPRRIALVLAAVLVASGSIGSAAADDEPRPDGTQQVLVHGADGSVTTVEVSEAELDQLRADPAAGPVVPRGTTVHAALAQSVPKVGAPTLWGTGQRGAGQVVVVIDTGVLPSFGGTLVGQACFAATQFGSQLVGHCGPDEDHPATFDSACFDLGVCSAPGGDVLDSGAARPCAVPPAAASDCYHGTAVAAVAARHEPTPGVAPDAGVYAIRVFDPSGTSADLVDVLLALDHVRRLADAGLPIAAVNLSVSTAATFPGSCDAGTGAADEAKEFRALFDQLLARGIPSVVASGNSGARGGLGLPACVSSAVSVGATDLDDDLADFSNLGPRLDLVAPGADEGNGALDRMDIPGSPLAQWAGTSFSAPHVAGAFALLGPQYPKASPVQLTGLLRATGVGVREPATGATYRRLRLLAPAQALTAGVLFPTDLPIGGTARAAVGDLDGDGHDDVLAHAPGSAPDRISFGDDDWTPRGRAYSVSGTYLPIVGQFHGVADGPEDIVWYAPGPAADSLWAGDASRAFPARSLTVNGLYAPIVGDYDGDGHDDIFWYGPGSAPDSLWYGGPSGFASAVVSVRGAYRVAVGDFDGDGRDDLLFHGPDGVPDSLWRGRAARGTWGQSPLSMNGSYTLRAGDVDGDGDDDLLLYQPGPRYDALWKGGPSVGGVGAAGGFATSATPVSGTYQPSMGDVDGDGRADILWYAPGPAADHLWFGRATGAPTSRPIVVNGTYTPLFADLDDDAGEEIVWFRSSAATTPVWWSYGP